MIDLDKLYFSSDRYRDLLDQIWEHIGLEQDFDKAEKILRDGLSITTVCDKEHITERLQDLQGKRKRQNRSNNIIKPPAKSLRSMPLNKDKYSAI
mgnify:CR=1 FL=1